MGLIGEPRVNVLALNLALGRADASASLAVRGPSVRRREALLKGPDAMDPGIM